MLIIASLSIASRNLKQENVYILPVYFTLLINLTILPVWKVAKRFASILFCQLLRGFRDQVRKWHLINALNLSGWCQTPNTANLTAIFRRTEEADKTSPVILCEHCNSTKRPNPLPPPQLFPSPNIKLASSAAPNNLRLSIPTVNTHPHYTYAYTCHSFSIETIA